jgi:hypothetical protein
MALLFLLLLVIVAHFLLLHYISICLLKLLNFDLLFHFLHFVLFIKLLPLPLHLLFLSSLFFALLPRLFLLSPLLLLHLLFQHVLKLLLLVFLPLLFKFIESTKALIKRGRLLLLLWNLVIMVSLIFWKRWIERLVVRVRLVILKIHLGLKLWITRKRLCSIYLLLLHVIDLLRRCLHVVYLLPHHHRRTTTHRVHVLIVANATHPHLHLLFLLIKLLLSTDYDLPTLVPQRSACTTLAEGIVLHLFLYLFFFLPHSILFFPLFLFFFLLNIVLHLNQILLLFLRSIFKTLWDNLMLIP